jgi:imidazolonepropionase-like amidohydrolase
LTPGLIDVHSHLGVYASPSIGATRDGNEMTGPMTAGVWAEHSFWPEDPGLERALRGGVTTLHVLPGSGNLIGGRGVTLRLRPTRGARAMRFPGAADSVKMACGENPKRVYGGRGAAPSTRMGNARGYREAFIAAKKYQKDVAGKAFGEVPRDLAMETLVGLLEGRVLAQVHCYTAQDMIAFLQVADEFGFSIKAFHHALEAWKVRDILSARGIAVATWADWWGFKLEGWDGIPQNAALIEAAGGRPIIHSDSGEGIQRLNQEAAKALRAAREAGLAVTPEAALRWVTANAAWALGLEAEVGTLAPGLRADLVLWDGPPFSVYARPMRVWIDGVVTLDRDRGLPAAPWSDFEAGLEQLRPEPEPKETVRVQPEPEPKETDRVPPGPTEPRAGEEGRHGTP